MPKFLRILEIISYFYIAKLKIFLSRIAKLGNLSDFEGEMNDLRFPACRQAACPDLSALRYSTADAQYANASGLGMENIYYVYKITERQ